MIDFIKQKEGFREKAAWDYAQYSTGYGSACGKDEYPNGITEAQADVLLRQMLQGFEKKAGQLPDGKQYFPERQSV